ncbi:hypothetical protein VZT92_003046 [Zoarces viviparus]|uniref:Uncharacterized protein n=1 Tax=Zoarces viviparus TaxID=48416 RepID=A0AAW1FZY9_ZOAVI
MQRAADGFLCVCEELPKPTSTEEADGDKLRPLCRWGRDPPPPLGWWVERVVSGGGAGRTSPYSLGLGLTGVLRVVQWLTSTLSCPRSEKEAWRSPAL